MIAAGAPSAEAWNTADARGFDSVVSSVRVAGSPLVPPVNPNAAVPPIDCFTIVTRGNRWLVTLQLNVWPGAAVMVTDGSVTVPTGAPSPSVQLMPVSTHPAGGADSVIVTVRVGTPEANTTPKLEEPTPAAVVIDGAGSTAFPDPVAVNANVASPPTAVFVMVTWASRTFV